jgi:hypothetical protein
MLVSCSEYSLSLKKGAIYLSETSFKGYLHCQRYETFKFCIIQLFALTCNAKLRTVQLILYDTVNRNKASIYEYINCLYFLFFTHYMFRPLRAILKWDILLIIFLFLKDYFNTTDPLHACNSIIISKDVICRHRFFQPIVLIHVIILNIKK